MTAEPAILKIQWNDENEDSCDDTTSDEGC
jgi:hypothetical protein